MASHKHHRVAPGCSQPFWPGPNRTQGISAIKSSKQGSSGSNCACSQHGIGCGKAPAATFTSSAAASGCGSAGRMPWTSADCKNTMAGLPVPHLCVFILLVDESVPLAPHSKSVSATFWLIGSAGMHNYRSQVSAWKSRERLCCGGSTRRLAHLAARCCCRISAFYQVGNPAAAVGSLSSLTCAQATSSQPDQV